MSDLQDQSKSIAGIKSMAETANVARISEKLSDSLFAEFHWKKTGPTNINWPCERSAEHSCETHPSDVVFYYDEPYENVRTYIHCDLKSYGATSIKQNSVKKAATSLAGQISCAEISETWQSYYTHDGHNNRIVGLLFIYNHDKEYDGNFEKLLWGVSSNRLPLPNRGRLFILSPSNILWLESVRYEILAMRALENEYQLPNREKCRYLYPQLSRKGSIRPGVSNAATLEMLTSPWIVMEYDPIDPRYARGIVIFYSRKVEGTVELRYLLDYLRHFQLLQPDTIVQIKVSAGNEISLPLFQKACVEYIEEIVGDDAEAELAKIIRRVKLSIMDHVVSNFSQIQIGMDYDRT